VLSETVFLLRAAGKSLEPLMGFLERGLVRLDFDLEPHRRDVFALLQKYQDQGMELADACLVKMAELADDVKVFTTDADFKSYRRKQRNQIPQLSPHIS
jgi:predicted nucleic acid-binding protein